MITIILLGQFKNSLFEGTDNTCECYDKCTNDANGDYRWSNWMDTKYVPQKDMSPTIPQKDMGPYKIRQVFRFSKNHAYLIFYNSYSRCISFNVILNLGFVILNMV